MSNFEEWAASGGLDVKKFPMSNIYKDADTRVASVAWQEQQKKIDELQAIVYGLKGVQNNLELKAEDAECVSMSLDDHGVAKCDDDGKTYSLWGRVCQFKKSNNITECDLERIYWEFDQERKNSDGERVVFKNTLRSLLNNLKGNKDEN